MSIQPTNVFRRYENVAEGVPVVVNLPLFVKSELQVYYCEAGLSATLNVDYTIDLNETDYSTFTFTPLAPLITKIDDQITAVPTDRNTVLLIRALAYGTEATPQASRNSDFVSRAFDRIEMKMQQIDYALSRVFKLSVFNENAYDLTMPDWASDKFLVWDVATRKLVTSTISASSIGALGDLSGYVDDALAAAAAAAASAAAAATAETNAETAETNAETAETNAETAATNALASQTAAAGSAADALADRVLAQAAAAAAAASQAAAATSEGNADTSEAAAAASAAAAATAQGLAEGARDAALAAFDSFDDKYLGAKAANPTLDNDGNALVDGAIYWNTTAKEWRVYDLATTTWFPLVGGDAASAISFVPYGNIVAVNVQDALQELDDEKFAKADIDVDGTLAANSDTKVASQKAVKTHVANAVAGILNGVSSAFDTLAEIAAELALKATINNASFTGTFTPPDNTIARSKLVNGSAVSVIGRSANSAGAVADIAAGANDRILARTGDALSFVQATFAMIASGAIAAAGNFMANTASRLLTAAAVWADAAEVPITYAATLPLDLSTFLNAATCVLTGNTTLGNPTNYKGQQCYTIWFTATGGTRTVSLGTNFKKGNTVETFPINVTTTETVGVHCITRSGTVTVVTGVTRYTT